MKFAKKSDKQTNKLSNVDVFMDIFVASLWRLILKKKL